MKTPVLLLISLVTASADPDPSLEKPDKFPKDLTKSGEGWKPAPQAPHEPETERTPEAVSPTLAFAKKLIVPRALFEATPLPEAVDFLRSMSRTGMEIDGAPAPFKLNFVVLDPDKRAKPVDLDVKSIPMDKLCEEVAAAAGMQVRFENEAVVFSPAPTVERHQDGKTPGEEHDES